MCVFGAPCFPLTYSRKAPLTAPSQLDQISNHSETSSCPPNNRGRESSGFTGLNKQVWSTVEWPVKPLPIPSAIPVLDLHTEPWKRSDDPVKTHLKERSSGSFLCNSHGETLMGLWRPQGDSVCLVYWGSMGAQARVCTQWKFPPVNSHPPPQYKSLEFFYKRHINIAVYWIEIQLSLVLII